MWFQVSLVRDKAPLSVLISADRSLFFKADDFGRFMGYKDPEKFAYKISRLTVKHVLSSLALPSLFSSRLLTLSEVLSFLRRRRSRYRFDVDRFERLWMHSQLERYAPITHHPSPEGSPTVTAVRVGGVCYFQDWLRDFIMVVVSEHRRKWISHQRGGMDDPVPEAVVDSILEEDGLPPLPTRKRVDGSESTVRSNSPDVPRRRTTPESSSDKTVVYDWPEGTAVVATAQHFVLLPPPSPPPLALPPQMSDSVLATAPNCVVLPSPGSLWLPPRLPAPDRLPKRIPVPTRLDGQAQTQHWGQDVRSASPVLWTRDATPPPDPAPPPPKPPRVKIFKFQVPVDNFHDHVVLEFDFYQKD